MVHPGVLTLAEAAHWLRLDDDYATIGEAVEAVNRLGRAGKFRRIRIGRTYKVPVAELERYVADETAGQVEPRTPSPKADGAGEAGEPDSPAIDTSLGTPGVES